MMESILEFSEPCKPFYIYMNARNDYKLTKKRIVTARDFHGKTKIYKSVAKSNNNIKINQSFKERMRNLIMLSGKWQSGMS